MNSGKYQSIAEFYDVNTNVYSSIYISDLNFSVRLKNCLRRTGIITVSDLMFYSFEEIAQIRNLGNNTLDELVEYLESLFKRKVVEQKSEIHKDFRAQIISGNFSFLDQNSFTAEEEQQLIKYKNSFELLGQDLVNQIVNNTSYILEIHKALYAFIHDTEKKYKYFNLIKSELVKLPKERLDLNLNHFIKAFTPSKSEREYLKELCGTANTFNELKNNANINSDEDCKALIKFIKWSCFDLNKQINNLFDKINVGNNTLLILQNRAKNKTLSEIGENLGVSRERIRQIEAKALRIFAKFYGEKNLLLQIFALENGKKVISYPIIKKYLSDYAFETFYLLKMLKSTLLYDSRLDLFVVEENENIFNRVQAFVDSLPLSFKSIELPKFVLEAQQQGLPEELINKTIELDFQLTNSVYHRNRLSLSTIYSEIIDNYFRDGIKIYDTDELEKFRRIIYENFGDVKLPSNDRAISSRLSEICILAGKGLYKPKQNSYLPKKLLEDIYNYIVNSPNTVFLTNTIFNVFKYELLFSGVDNRFYLQGILHELYGDEFVFRRDYISKDKTITSVYPEIINYIKKSDYPVNKEQIAEAFPGITDIIITFSVNDPDVLNFFGEYLHSSRLKIFDTEKSYLFHLIEKIVSDDTVHHGKEFHEIISKENPEMLSRNAALYPFSTYSILEFLFREKFQFSRPYIAKKGIDIAKPIERLHDLIYTCDEISLSEVSEFIRENHIQIPSLLDYFNSCNDEYLIANDDMLIKISSTGLDKRKAEQIDEIIAEEISESVLIANLNIWDKLPDILIPWDEWLIYSVILKWGKKTVVGTTSNQFRLSVPIIAPLGNLDERRFDGYEKSKNVAEYEIDDLNNLDILIEDMIDDLF